MCDTNVLGNLLTYFICCLGLPLVHIIRVALCISCNVPPLSIQYSTVGYTWRLGLMLFSFLFILRLVLYLLLWYSLLCDAIQQREAESYLWWLSFMAKNYLIWIKNEFTDVKVFIYILSNAKVIIYFLLTIIWSSFLSN